METAGPLLVLVGFAIMVLLRPLTDLVALSLSAEAPDQRTSDTARIERGIFLLGAAFFITGALNWGR